MRIRLFPRDEGFFEMFDEQVKKVVYGARLLKEMMENFQDLETMAKRIKEVEEDGDSITHRIVEKLNRTFVTPIDREDIHNLTSRLDDVLDYMEAVAERIILFKIKKKTQEAVMLSDVLLKSVLTVEKAVYNLKNLKKADEILNDCIEINRLENIADCYLREAVANLFEIESDPREIIKWKEIYENLENAVDRCEDVANIIEGVILKYS